jgi:hypothetical protein
VPSSNTGQDFSVYANMIFMYGHNVLRTPVTKTESNITGDETLTDGTPEVITVYFSRKNAPWTFDKAGLIQGGDAQMLTQDSQTINKNDKIAYDGITYRVQDVLARDQIGGIVAYKTCNLFKIS